MRLRIRGVPAGRMGVAGAVDGPAVRLERARARALRRHVFDVDRLARVGPQPRVAAQLRRLYDLLACRPAQLLVHGCARPDGLGDGLHAGESITARTAARAILPDDARAVGL